jgi:hypothetical protein
VDGRLHDLCMRHGLQCLRGLLQVPSFTTISLFLLFVFIVFRRNYNSRTALSNNCASDLLYHKRNHAFPFKRPTAVCISTHSKINMSPHICLYVLRKNATPLLFVPS